MKKTKANLAVLFAVSCLVVVTTPVRANEPEGLQVSITPFAWMAGMEGDVSVGGHKASFDKEFSDLIDAVDIAGSLHSAIQYDRYLLWIDGDFMDLSTDKLDVEDRPEGGTFDTSLVMLEGAAGYQVDGWLAGQTIDFLVGLRSLSIDNDLTINGVGTVSSDASILDPVIIMRPSTPIFVDTLDGLRFDLTLGIGGALGDSDLVYEITPQFAYVVNDTFDVNVGYRCVGYKFEGEHSEANELNLRLAGVILGLTASF